MTWLCKATPNFLYFVIEDVAIPLGKRATVAVTGQLKPEARKWEGLQCNLYTSSPLHEPIRSL